MSLKYIISIVLFLLSAKTYLRIIYCLNLILNTLETAYTPCVVETDLARMNTVPRNIFTAMIKMMRDFIITL